MKNNSVNQTAKFWTYFLSISLAVVVTIVAVVIGIVYGLKKKKNSSGSSSSSSSQKISSSSASSKSSFSSSSSLPPVVNTKLVGTGVVNHPKQGTSVAISGDGLTVAVGAPFQNTNVGCVYVWVYNAGTWTQQAQLVVSGSSEQGTSCSLSSNGNTLIFGGPNATSSAGVAYIYTRTGTTWSLQQTVNGTSSEQLGLSVAIDGNGLIAAVGIPAYSTTGGFYVLTYTGSWTQTGPFFAASSSSNQGITVAISTDGNTIASADYVTSMMIVIFKYVSNTWTFATSLTVSGSTSLGRSISLDNTGINLVSSVTYSSNDGYVMLFQYNSGTWLQSLLLPAELTSATVSSSVSISQDASTLIIGNTGYNVNSGAIWVFNMSGGAFTQTSLLVGTGNIGAANQGYSVSVSSNGTTCVEGGLTDNSFIGAAWVFNNI